MNAGTTSAWQPQREIQIIAGTPRGAGLDRTARALATALESTGALDVPVKVINMPGDASRKIWKHLDRHPGDPHVLVITSPNVTTDYLTGLSAFDHDSYTPLAILHDEYLSFVVRADSTITGGASLIDRLRVDAGSVNAAVATSLGNPNHVALAKVTAQAGGNTRALKVFAFDSARDAIDNVMAGGTDLAVISAASAVPELTAGTMRALAVAASTRLGGCYAQAPTWLEQGIDCALSVWRGADGASGLAAPEISFWNQAMASATASDTWRTAIERGFWSPLYLDGKNLHERLARERAEMQSILSELELLRIS
ncbi:MAG: hypothetical protein JWN94_4931 [Betaproteobacteria bacterium]|nr:hypothetical protein [Betaproteobacteria bacterium]